MKIDYGKVLKMLPFNSPPSEISVTQSMIESKALAMARRGYNHNATSLTALELYMKGYGLLLSGPVGVGKTMFFRTVEPDGGIPILSFNSCVLWEYEELRDFLRSTRNDDIVIDDLGWDRANGDGMSRKYGQKYDALQIVLDFRTSASPMRTHITTNLDNDGLIKAYDYHLVDRIYELCKPVAWSISEPSKRMAAPNKTAVERIAGRMT